MTCKDCLHYEVCIAIKNAMGMGMADDEGEAEDCFGFQPSTEWVHLPCKVGDEIFYLRCMKVHSVNVVESNMIGFKVVDSKNISWSEYWDAFGNFYFSSKEEAEKELERRKEK